VRHDGSIGGLEIARLQAVLCQTVRTIETANELATFQSFWHGGPLTPYEAACLASFVRKGHEFHLYTYHGDLEVPAGVKRCDAARILPPERYFTYGEEAREGAGSPAAFANLFRYKLLAESGGWWVDTDVFLVGDTVPDGEVFAAFQESGLANSAVLRLPAGHPAAIDALRRCEEIGRGSRWGETGPKLVTALFERHGLMADVAPMMTAYPVHYTEALDLMRPTRTAVLRERARGATFLHLWNEIFRRQKLDKTLRPPEDSLLRELFDSVGATGWRGECPRNLFDEHANDGAIRIPGRTRRQRRIIVTLLSLFGIAATVNSTSGK